MMRQNRSLKFWNLRIAILCLCAWYGFMLTSNAQWDMETKKNSQDSKTDFKNMSPSTLTNPTITNTSVQNAPPLEGSVDPDAYFVGPSDLISVNIWTSPQLVFPLTVTPEGTLIIPTVGEIHVADLTLSEVKKKVIAEIKKKYLSGNPTVTLLSPRQIIVTVTGAVRYPGKYILYATDRVDNAITLANKKQKDVIPETKDINLGKEIRKDIATQFDESYQTRRNIRVTRHTGSRRYSPILLYQG